ncbi:MAG TPA: hypothetical protein VGX27_00600, partial [Candidatus Dormibacteraeota bacterium]|nr:hypothetical protein [Candidatus Dormibacteraeota bacterium]
MFAAWGRFVYRNRWAVLVGSGVLLVLSVVSLAMGGTLQSGGPLSSNLESAKAGNLTTSQLHTAKTTSNFDLIFKSNTLQVSDPQYQSAVTEALAPIQNDSRIASITTPYDTRDPRIAAAFTSKDGHEALVSFELYSTGPQSWKDYSDLRG